MQDKTRCGLLVRWAAHKMGCSQDGLLARLVTDLALSESYALTSLLVETVERFHNSFIGLSVKLANSTSAICYPGYTSGCMQRHSPLLVRIDCSLHKSLLVHQSYSLRVAPQ